jgi:long-chain acyl-CoA synthetase
MDSDGYISIVDRIKDVIIVSGFNVYPNEVEDAIVKHADVLECSVIGVPDEGTDEKVVAFVVPRTTALTDDSVLAFCRQHLTNYKMPVDIVFTNDLPYSMVGKVLRRALRKRYKNQDYVRRSSNRPNRHG